MKGIKSLITPIERAIRVVDKANPFQKKIDKNDVSDTGMESVRLADQSVRTVAKVTVNVFKVAESVWNHAAAAMLNPVIWVILLLAFMTVLLGAVVVIIIDAGAVNTETAYVSASGLGVVDEKYLEGLELFRAAENTKRIDFNCMIQSAYDGDPRSECDLIYMEKTYPDPSGTARKSFFEVSFASQYYKEVMENAWNLGINEVEGVAITYIYLQKQANAAKHTEMDIYDVQYTPEVFAKILEMCVKYSDTKTENVECPGANCDWYKDWYWDDDDWDYDYVDFCPHHHTLHCFGLAFYSKKDIMSALGFTKKECEWEELTEKYFLTLTT